DLAEALVEPVDAVDPERDERQHDREADAALLAERAGVRRHGRCRRRRCCGWRCRFRCAQVTPSVVVRYGATQARRPDGVNYPNPSEMIPRSTSPRVNASEATTLTPYTSRRNHSK